MTDDFEEFERKKLVKMMDGLERSERNTLRASRLRAILNQVVGKMQAEGWDPVRLKGHSRRFRCTIPGQGECIVALKIVGRRYPGWIGFQQKVDGAWNTPLTDSDFLLFATPYLPAKPGLGVWMFPISRVIERLEAVQQHYDERGGMPGAALWFNIFDRAPRSDGFPPWRLNFAEGEPELWQLPLEQPAQEKAEGEPAAVDQPTGLPSLASYTLGQLLDELQRRGMKSFSF